MIVVNILSYLATTTDGGSNRVRGDGDTRLMVQSGGVSVLLCSEAWRAIDEIGIFELLRNFDY